MDLGLLTVPAKLHMQQPCTHPLYAQASSLNLDTTDSPALLAASLKALKGSSEYKARLPGGTSGMNIQGTTSSSTLRLLSGASRIICLKILPGNNLLNSSN